MTGNHMNIIQPLKLRSMLFVPGDRPDRMRKAMQSGADALILDLEDSVAPATKDLARGEVAAFLAEFADSRPVFVRINALGTGHVEQDLAILAETRPAGILLPKAEGARSIEILDRLLTEQGDRDTPVMPIATETPAAMFRLGEYAGCPRLIAMTWGAEDLSAAIGAMTPRRADGTYTAPYEIARSMLLFAAGAAGVSAIETVYPAIHDLDGLGRYVRKAARDGFVGMMAVHPSQVPIINAGFTPSPEQAQHARMIVAAFEVAPGVGAIMLEGRMIDQPHLTQALNVLARSQEGAERSTE